MVPCRLDLITLLVFAVFLVGSDVYSFDLGDWVNSSVPHIIGGVKADIKDFPFQVSVRKRGQPYGYGHVCGGSIVDDRHVLTAAHCIAIPTLPDLYFVVADLKGLSKGTQYRVKNVMIHEKYKNSDPFQYDVAVLRLNNSLVLGPGINVKPIQLVPLGVDTPPKSNVVVAGWGRTILGNTDPERDYSEDLMKLDMKIVARDECARCLGKTHKITERAICAGAGGNTKRDASIGDSGGPLVDASKGTQLGIVSFGAESAASRCPGVYTNLANDEVRKFVERAIKS